VVGSYEDGPGGRCTDADVDPLLPPKPFVVFVFTALGTAWDWDSTSTQRLPSHL
jgi:hypothetical protein